ncbi:hypothetical protein D3C85_292940 [compost metagenome]
MNKDQIAWIQKLDPNQEDGTLLQVLLQKNLNELPFEKALVFLVQALKNDKTSLQRENKAMSRALKDNGLYTAENIGLV